MKLAIDEASGTHSLARASNIDEGSSALSAADLFRMVLRRKWFILGCALLCGLIGYAYVRSTPPSYEATATLRIDPGRASSLGLNDLLSGSSVDTSDLARTEIAVMQTDQVAITTINSLSDQDYAALTGSARSAPIPPKSADISKQQEREIATFKSHLTVKPVTDTQLVAISFKDKNPQLAATVVNHVVDTYLKQSFDNRYGSVQQVEDWLSGQMAELKTRSQDAQQKLAKFQEQHNIVDTGPAAAAGQDTATTTTDRLRMLNERLTTAESDRIVKEAQMRAATTQNPAVLASMFPDQKFQTLQTQQATLYTQYAQLSAKFGSKYAPLEQIQEQLKLVNAEIKRSAEQIQTRLTEDYEASKGAEQMLRGDYNTQMNKAYAQNREQADLASLQAEGKASTQLYNTLQVKLQQAGVDAGLNGVNTMRVDVARPPLTPTGPGKSTTVLAATMLGLILSIASVFAVEFTSERIQNATQMEAAALASVVGAIPGTKAAAASPDGSATIPTLSDPYSEESEAYRGLRNLLFLGNDAPSCKSLLITSSSPGEGKTAVACNLAVVLAQAGFRVLVVDAELARPSLAQRFGISQVDGLCTLLRGEACSYTTPVASLANLSLLPAGQNADVGPDTMANRFPGLLQSWEREFDYVLVKAAPLLFVSDGLVLAKHVQGTLLVCRHDVSSVSELTKTSESLRRMGARIAGLVLIGMSTEKGKRDRYGRQHAG